MSNTVRSGSSRPLISVVMANYQAGAHILPALHSVLAQSQGDLEIIVSDDASGDDSLSHVRAIMARDSRVRLLESQVNSGPARCRNAALAAARGEWIAIVDSDDIIHPERFERLLAAGRHFEADIVADDLMLFFEDGAHPRLMLDDRHDRPFFVDTEHWVLSGVDGTAPLGYLKPLFRSALLADKRYDEQLRIGEDFDLVLRLLLDNARLVVVPEPFYLYRRHSSSISHRLKPVDMMAMVARQEALVQKAAGLTASERAAFDLRIAELRKGLSYEELVAAVKSKDVVAALANVARRPANLWRLWKSFVEGRRRRAAANHPPELFGAEHLILGGHQGDPLLPDYVPIQSIDWSRPSTRGIWLELAGRAGRGGRVTASGDAGVYAAGFLPEAKLQHAPHPAAAEVVA